MLLYGEVIRVMIPKSECFSKPNLVRGAHYICNHKDFYLEMERLMTRAAKCDEIPGCLLGKTFAPCFIMPHFLASFVEILRWVKHHFIV